MQEFEVPKKSRRPKCPTACHASWFWCGRRRQQSRAPPFGHCKRREEPELHRTHTSMSHTKPTRELEPGAQRSRTDFSNQTTKLKLSGRLSRCSVQKLDKASLRRHAGRVRQRSCTKQGQGSWGAGAGCEPIW